MKGQFSIWGLLFLFTISFLACNSNETTAPATEAGGGSTPPTLSGQSGVKDDQSQKDVVKIAVGSPDHTTLVKALQQADYVDALSNAGPFTVFAPVNAAFDKLPKGTLDDLMKPEKKDALRSILEYHVFVGVLKPEMLLDGQTYGQASGENITIHVKDGKLMVNNAHIIASIPASNGIIHVIDEVLLAPAK